jgi:hypothetical protein
MAEAAVYRARSNIVTNRRERKEALAFMIALMEIGVEYPDAQFQTTCSFEVEAEQLQNDYDEFCQTQGLTLE